MSEKYLVKNGREIGERAIEFEQKLRVLLNEHFELGVYDVDIAGLHLLFEQILYEVFSDNRVKTFQTEFEISDTHNEIDREMRKIILEIYGNNIDDINAACILMTFECLKWEYYDHLFQMKKQKDNPIISILIPALQDGFLRMKKKDSGGYHS